MATADEPPAFLSHPSDVALLQRYLGPRVVSGGLACSWIHEEDLYAADPADLTARHPAATDGDGESVWYFFTPIRTKKGFKDKRKNRAVPSGLGSWFSERAAKPVVAVDGARREVVGQKQTFAFTEKDEEGDRIRSGWLMVELRLPGDVPLALCKVYFTPRAAKATVAAAADPRTEIVPSTGPPPEHGVPRTKTAPPPEHRTPRPSEEAVPGAPPLLPDPGTSGIHTKVNLTDPASPRPRGMPGTHGEDAASSAPPTACRTPSRRRISGMDLEDAARAATPSAEWLLVQIDARDSEQTVDGISLRRVYRILPFEDDGNDKLASAPPRPKKRFGWLMSEGVHGGQEQQDLGAGGASLLSVAMEGAAASSNNAGRSLGDGAATEAQADADMEEAVRVE